MHGLEPISLREVSEKNPRPSHADKFQENEWDEHHSYKCKDFPGGGASSVSVEVAAAQKKCTGYEAPNTRAIII